MPGNEYEPRNISPTDRAHALALNLTAGVTSAMEHNTEVGHGRRGRLLFPRSLYQQAGFFLKEQGYGPAVSFIQDRTFCLVNTIITREVMARRRRYHHFARNNDILDLAGYLRTRLPYYEHDQDSFELPEDTPSGIVELLEAYVLAEQQLHALRREYIHRRIHELASKKYIPIQRFFIVQEIKDLMTPPRPPRNTDPRS